MPSSMARLRASARARVGSVRALHCLGPLKLPTCAAQVVFFRSKAPFRPLTKSNVAGRVDGKRLPTRKGLLVIDRDTFKRMIRESAKLMLDQADRLSDIDSRFGDGDHGITITKIAKLMNERVDAWDDRSIKEFLDDLGMGAMAVRGGSAGPLYGTMISGLGVELGDDENELSADAARRMFAGCLAEMRDITSAVVGDKTMMDALVPAVDAAQACDVGEEEAAAVFVAAAEAAEAGAKASEGFASKFGRARSYGEATVGTPDAGAVSTSLFLRGLAEGASRS